MATQNRTKKILGEPAHKAIASSPEEQVYRIVTEAAVYLACSGFLDSANELLAHLWSYKLDHSRDVWMADRAMCVLWHHAGGYPSTIPFAVPEIESIELEHRRYMTGNRWHEAVIHGSSKNPKSLAIRRLAKAMIASYPRNDLGPMPRKGEDLEAIADFTAFAESQFCIGHNAFSALTNLVELCAKYDLTEDAARYLLLWQNAAIEYWSNFSFECLASCRHAAPLLARGLLAKGFQLDLTSSERYVEGLCTALQERMRAGRSLAYGKLSWQQLLDKISSTAIAQKEMPFPPQSVEANWLGSPSASAAAIGEAEKRLSTSLPEDYKSFLLVADGFQPLFITSVRLFAIGEVKWLREAMPDLVATWGAPGADESLQLLNQSLLIGDLEGEQQLFLVPSESANSDGGWECWFFANWIPGEVRHPSFRVYMEDVLLNLEGNAGN